jgi:hypothetical protein
MPQPLQAGGQPARPQWMPPSPPDFSAIAAGTLTSSPVDEIAALQPVIKQRRDFAKQLLVLTTASPADPFYARLYSEAMADINVMAARLEALRPPEARLAGVTGALNNKRKVLAKAVADLAAADSQRSIMAQWVDDVTLEVTALEAQYSSLTTVPAATPPAANMAALEALLASMGATSVMAALKVQLLGLGVTADEEMPPAQAHSSGPPAPSPFVPQGAQEAAAALATASQRLFFGAGPAATPAASDAADLGAASVAAESGAPLTELGRAHALTLKAQAAKEQAVQVTARYTAQLQEAQASADAECARYHEAATAAEAEEVRIAAEMSQSQEPGPSGTATPRSSDPAHRTVDARSRSPPAARPRTGHAE